jgi:hypothetical protein
MGRHLRESGHFKAALSARAKADAALKAPLLHLTLGLANSSPKNPGT